MHTPKRVWPTNPLQNHEPPAEAAPAAEQPAPAPPAAVPAAPAGPSPLALAEAEAIRLRAEAARVAAQPAPAPGQPVPAPAAVPAPVVDPQAVELQSLRNALQANTSLVQSLAADLAAERLNNHRTATIAAYAQAGIVVPVQYVFGDTPEAINANAALAAAEVQLIEQRTRVAVAAEQAEAARIAGIVAQQPRVIPANTTPAPVAGLPSHVVPGAPGAGAQQQTGGILSQAEYDSLMTAEAVRDGRFAANKDLILAHKAMVEAGARQGQPGFTHGLPGQQQPAPPQFGVSSMNLGGVRAPMGYPHGGGPMAPPQPQLLPGQQYPGASSQPSFRPVAQQPIAPSGGIDWNAVRARATAGRPSTDPT